MEQLHASAIFIVYSNALLLNTGKVPGIPWQMGHVFMFGCAPNFVEQEQKAFELVSN
jgi:hypothetical protein